MPTLQKKVFRLPESDPQVDALRCDLGSNAAMCYLKNKQYAACARACREVLEARRPSGIAAFKR